MHALLLWTVVALSLLVAVVGGAISGLGVVADRLLLGVAGVAEVVVIVQSVVAAGGLLSGHHLLSPPTFVGYLIGIVLVLPVAVVWAWADRSRWTGAVVALGGLTVAVMTARLQMMWAGNV